MGQGPAKDTRRILLLRGVNVGGVKLPMAEFRAMLSSLGLDGVASYIQSGNAVFRCPGDPRAAIAEGLRLRFGLGSELFLYDVPTYRAILTANPFVEAGRIEGARVHIFFLARPAVLNLETLLAWAEPGEALHVSDAAIYFNAPLGMGRSVLAEKLARAVKVPMTARNQRSAEAILALAEGL